jgi:hypothetical protein
MDPPESSVMVQFENRVRRKERLYAAIQAIIAG